MTLISIIVPVYNGEKTIAACLQSIRQQTVADHEVIAVNDGSTDDTLKVLNQFRDKIKIITQQNQGASAARNRGAQAATAPFLIFWDADIQARPVMLERMHDALRQHPDCSYAYSSFRFGVKTFKLFAFSAEKLRQMPYIHTTSLLRREHFPGFDERLKKFQDWDLWLTMLGQGHTGCLVDEVLFAVKAGGTMSAWLPSFAYRLPLLRRLKSVRSYQDAEAMIKQKHQL